MAYRDGFDSKWFPWPPQTPKQLMSVGVFTYKHPKNLTATDEVFVTTKPTTLEQQQLPNNGTSSNALVEDRRFNLHPTLMTAGFITLTGFCKYTKYRNSRLPIKSHSMNMNNILCYVTDDFDLRVENNVSKNHDLIGKDYNQPFKYIYIYSQMNGRHYEWTFYQI